MDLLRSAVSNNVEWCAAVCSGSGTVDSTNRVWLTAGRPAPLFPDAVTLERGVSACELVEMVSDRQACSIKDSYADVDLEAHGFTELFTGRWIARAAEVSTTPARGWSQITERSELQSWCRAAGLPRALPVGLLRDSSVRILAAHRRGRVVAGAIANSSNTVIGISNVFQVGAANRWVWHEVASVVAGLLPGQPLVGYEHGPDLDHAVAAGFIDLGPVRVWLRSPLP